MDPQTKALITEVAREAAEQAVSNAFTRLGIDNSDPLAMQKDMGAVRRMRTLLNDPELQADLAHLRRWRKTMDSVQSKGLLVTISIIISGGLATLWLGFKDVLTGGN